MCGLMRSTYIFFGIKPDVFTVIIALFFTKPLLNHFLWHTQWHRSKDLNWIKILRSLSDHVPQCYHGIFNGYDRKWTKKSVGKVTSQIRMSEISRFIFKFNTFFRQNWQFCCRTFSGLENSMTIYLFHLILIILANINSFPNILFQASKLKFLTYLMLHMLKTLIIFPRMINS